MRLKFPMAFAAAFLLAAADFVCGVPEAWGFGPGGVHSAGARPASRSNFQRFRNGNISRFHLNGSHVKSFKVAKNFQTSHPALKSLSGTEKYSLIGQKGSKPGFKELILNPYFQRASIGQPNIWYDKQWGGSSFHRHHGRWFRWYGPVFWPYFSGDYFCYGLSPDFCSGVFWGYGPDTILWGAFWPYSEYYYDEDAAYAAAGAGDIYAPYRAPARIASKEPDANAIAESCAGLAPGLSGLPIEKLQAIIGATEAQRTALEGLKAAASLASDILSRACPSEPPHTPVGRLDAILQRLQAMEEANQAVKGPFQHLYGLLTDGQKRRLEAVSKPFSKPQPAPSSGVDIAGLCSSQARFTGMPMDRIASTAGLAGEQQRELEKLKAAAAKAADGLKASCPSSVPDTLAGRLDAAQQRIAALIAAVETVRPALASFYASLTDEQKAALTIQAATQNRG